ncbi:MAG: hypothetical protein OZ914_08200 [Anaerolineaceae bacterium]|nr:hypothetical protein [Anaerolineaceae bacterium]
MYTLKPDERITPVMLYTRDTLVSGKLATKQHVLRVNIWLRTASVPTYMHILESHVAVFTGGSAPITLTCPEIYFPVSELIAFHTMPPTDEPLDYESTEANRTMQAVKAIVGTFLMKGYIRMSTQTDIEQNLEIVGAAWMSLYDVEISNLSVPRMPVLRTPMLLLNPMRVIFAVE